MAFVVLTTHPGTSVLSGLQSPHAAFCNSGRQKCSPRGLKMGAAVQQTSSEFDVNDSMWKCVDGCGACCYLAPDDRPYLEDLLSADQLDTFRGLVGPDGWCIQYNRTGRSCNIYESRPVFCRVKTWLSSKAPGFGVDVADTMQLDTFCSHCCREHINDVYGMESDEMRRFDEAVPVGLDDDDMDDIQVEGSAIDMADGWRVLDEWGGNDTATEENQQPEQ